MKLSLKIFQTNNQWLKVLSLIFGYLFWLVLVQNQSIINKINMPVGFYNLNNNLELNTNETIAIKISGKRLDLSQINIYQMASMHIDLNDYKIPGQYKIALNENNFIIDKKLKLIDYPQEIVFTLKEKKELKNGEN